MKKIFFVFVCLVLASSLCFAAPRKTAAGNGNGGKDKIGGWLGLPYVGLSYSHEFNDLVEFDLLAGVSSTFYFPIALLSLRGGALFTVFDPVIDGQKCPLTIGPALDITAGLYGGAPTGIGLSVSCPVRWEVNFSNVPAFNLFIEVAPSLGFYYSGKDYYGNSIITFDYVPYAGIGLRARIPNRK